MTAPILLDLSRLLGRAHRGAPTGIDRVEHAYAEQMLAQIPDRVHFVAIDKLDRLCLLPLAATARFVAMVGRHWAGGGASSAEVGHAARLIWVQALLRPGWASAPWLGENHGRGERERGERGRGRERPFYMLVSHRHLHRRARLERAIAPMRARLVTFVHDLIPIEFPEYARPAHAELHLQRIRTAAALSEGIIVNSQATADALAPYLAEAGRAPPVLVAPLGVRPLPPGGSSPLPGPGLPDAGLPDAAQAGTAEAGTAEAGAPYFVCLGTIEPRKNHLLLLHVWRRLAERHGSAAPRLIIVGRRGWEHENVEDMLERSPAIRGLVSERSRLSDEAVGALLRGCRALLFPSFAEGFGLPLAEALASGVPALCSDLPVLREVGGGVPEYLDTLDGLAWLTAAEDYAAPGSARRAAQLRRLAGWRGAAWPDHVGQAIAFSRGLLAVREAA